MHVKHRMSANELENTVTKYKRNFIMLHCGNKVLTERPHKHINNQRMTIKLLINFNVLGDTWPRFRKAAL